MCYTVGIQDAMVGPSFDRNKHLLNLPCVRMRGIEETRKGSQLRLRHRKFWCEGGILAGLLARPQTYGKTEQRRALNDALIFLTAAKNGCTVLTRNIWDFDLLMQLSSGKVVFYDPNLRS